MMKKYVENSIHAFFFFEWFVRKFACIEYEMSQIVT